MKRLLFTFLAGWLAGSLAYAENNEAKSSDMGSPLDTQWEEAVGWGDRNDYDTYLSEGCYTYGDNRCFDPDNESAIADAVRAAAFETAVILVGDKVVVLDRSEYYVWQEFMSDNLAKGGSSLFHLVAIAPLKIVAGALVSTFGLFAAPFEEKGEHGDILRRGIGLTLKGVLDVPKDALGVAAGTVGVPVYAVALAATPAVTTVKDAAAEISPEDEQK